LLLLREKRFDAKADWRFKSQLGRDVKPGCGDLLQIKPRLLLTPPALSDSSRTDESAGQFLIARRRALTT